MDDRVLKVAETIKKSIPTPKGPWTIADIAAKSGLSLRDSEQGLQFLTSEYRGHLAATSKGELIFEFPYGFSKPWEKTEALERVWLRVKKALLGAAKLIVRAWISIVMIAYVVIFAVILIALSSSKSDRDKGDSGGGALVSVLFRLIADSLFWTFHPFSPFNVAYRDPYPYRVRSKKNDVPFYEKVNRYFFGPEDLPQDPNATQRKLVELIRAKRGRIGITDVMKVTGLAPREADPLLARLMLDYDGEVSVSDDGSLIYTFKDLRKTVQETLVLEPSPIWTKRESVKPLTGNPSGSNVLITALNGFNLFMSTVAISQSWTLEKLQFLLSGGGHVDPWTGVAAVAPTGTPLLLGWIPFWFSAVLFALPLIRWLRKPSEKKKVDRENGRRGLLFAVLHRLTKKGISEQAIKTSWEHVAQAPMDEKMMLQEVVKLGGDIEYGEDGQAIYRFKQIEKEVESLGRERQFAPEKERDIGGVIFSSAT